MRSPVLRLHHDELVVDNFAGGGGASTGIEWALGRSPDIAINHDRDAIAMHTRNHPATRHYCEDVWKVDPKEACGGRPVGLAWFSPDCKHFSKAKGGKPVEKNIRGLAWVVTRWAKAVRPRVIILENVEEFQDWGPLLEDGMPCPVRRGLTFRRWLGVLRNAGYEVEVRQLRAMDFGAPTSRKRLFVIARSDGLPIVWPQPTHGPRLEPYRNAAECIDFGIPAPSIFERKRPLAENTLRRIARGLQRFVFESADPFIVRFAHGEQDSKGKRRGRGEHSLREPLPTVVASNEFGLVAPSLIQRGYGERPGQDPRVCDIRKPLPTVVAGGIKHGLVQAFLARHYGGHENDGAALQLPIPTITTKDHHALVTSHLLKLRGGLADHQLTAQDLRAPAPTLTAGGTHLAEVRAFLVAYFGNEKDGGQLDLPMRTVTTKDRFGLVTVHGTDYVLADIGMRMLVPRELFNAQGFPASYLIDGLNKTAQVRMAGNSVCPPIARALVAANFGASARQVGAA